MSMASAGTVASAGAPGGNAGARPQQAFGMAEVLRLVKNRGALIRNVTLGVVAVTAIVLFILPSMYSGTAVVMLDPRKNNVADPSAVLSEIPTDPASVQNQIQILTSRDLAGAVIQHLDLVEDPDYNDSLAPFSLNPLHWFGTTKTDPEQQYASVVDNFLRHLSVDALGLSTAIQVKFSAEDPAKAARVANAIVDAYIQSEIAVNADAGHRTTAWLVQRIRDLARQVEVAEANVQRYKAEHAITDTGDGTTSIVDQQLTAINTQLVQARADLAAKQANYERIQALLKSGDAADVSQVVSSPLIVQLRTQQSDAIRDKAEIDSRYGPKHPKRVAAESQLRDIQAKIDLEVNRIAGSVANDLAVARAQTRSLEASLQQAEAQANDQNLARVQLKALESDAASTRTMYESFVSRLRESQGQDAVATSDARIISHASVPTRPSSPKRTLLIAASLPAGLLLGLLWALVLERAQPLQSRQFRARAPVLVEAPQAVFLGAADLVSDAQSSPFARAMLTLARRVANGGPRIIAIASTDPRDGQSNVAVGLSRMLSYGGKRVVLIDAHPPQTFWTTGAAPAAATLDEALGGSMPLGRTFSRDPRSGVLLLACPPSAWLSGRMAEIMRHLGRTSDVVVIDAPPLDSVEFTKILPFTQAILAVVRKGPRADELASALAQSRIPAALVLTA